MKKTIKFGIFGYRRGEDYYKSILANNGSIVAVCDKSEDRLALAKEELGNIATYTNFEDFINHPDIEAVFLCNYFNEHTKYAIRALEKDIHVLTECTSNATMAEGVALVRAAEKSKAVFMIAENYPYMIFNKEMKRVYDGGSLGRCLYAEGEYNHPIDPEEIKSITKYRPYKTHWRNMLPRAYYITHSLGPLMYITGAFPKRVTAFGVYTPDLKDGLGGLYVGDSVAIINTLNDDNSVFRVTGCAAFGAHERSYRICGMNGQIENLRDGSNMVSLRYNSWQIPEGLQETQSYAPSWNDPESAMIQSTGHGGSDYLVIREFLGCIRENRRPFFDVYCATTMASVAILAHRSLLENGKPYDIPDFSRDEDRALYENDNLTPFYGEDGSEPTLPTTSHPDYAPSTYEVEAYLSLLK